MPCNCRTCVDLCNYHQLEHRCFKVCFPKTFFSIRCSPLQIILRALGNFWQAIFTEIVSHPVTSVCGRHFYAWWSDSVRLICDVLAPAENDRIDNGCSNTDMLARPQMPQRETCPCLSKWSMGCYLQSFSNRMALLENGTPLEGDSSRCFPYRLRNHVVRRWWRECVGVCI